MNYSMTFISPLVAEKFNQELPGWDKIVSVTEFFHLVNAAVKLGHFSKQFIVLLLPSSSFLLFSSLAFSICPLLM